MWQGLHSLLSRVPLLHDLLTAVNVCTTVRNAMWSRKKLLALILRPPTIMRNERRGDGHVFYSP